MQSTRIVPFNVGAIIAEYETGWKRREDALRKEISLEISHAADKEKIAKLEEQLTEYEAARNDSVGDFRKAPPTTPIVLPKSLEWLMVLSLCVFWMQAAYTVTV